eukprot:NODE_2434_length_935_cov_312.985227.p1 GENE.NODE_2434_length_935_cov_312.985227~~NODE_2434_length_935_cov_312.985227.p1  ORF type:complete len:276 (+),score=35.07 NODE_2434_length_935_cov_312.985227:3-830(+)
MGELHGRFLAAQREVSALEAAGEDPGRILNAVALERIRRICHLHEKSQELLSQVSDLSSLPLSETNGNTSWGCRVEGHTMLALFSATLEVDIVKFFALNQEHDVSALINKDIQEAKPLGAETPNDSVWRIIEKSALSAADNIVTKSSLNALDEDPPAIYWFDVAEPEATQELRGHQLTPARVKYTRSPYFVAARVTPSWDASGRLSSFATLGETARKLVAAMPRFILKAGISTMMSRNGALSEQYLSGPATMLVERMAAGTRAPLYAHLHERLAR